MTRIEKNQIKKKYKRLNYIALISVLSFLVFLALSLIFRNYDFIRMSAAIISSLAISALFIISLYNVANERKLSNYRAELRYNKDWNKLKMCINFINSRNYNKAIDIHKTMKTHDLRVYVKAFLTASYKNSKNSEFQDKANEMLNEIFEK